MGKVYIIPPPPLKCLYRPLGAMPLFFLKLIKIFETTGLNRLQFSGKLYECPVVGFYELKELANCCTIIVKGKELRL